ncbi:Splicing factor U2AF-associated protein 2 [Porphyridium purpureum]|uniref:Splicing factor U2AF-associated protein 2 n=1 Tax=Porphyridium purpureum TaxID=35688 RepID=A0A5J4YR60_PORPP|nr:Splicing factor U2AF-associated protein 2 [Porphyridium purpureum]|eukprot:POR7193..scf229_5
MRWWMAEADGRIHGPYDADALSALWTARAAHENGQTNNPDAPLVWEEGDEAWQPLEPAVRKLRAHGKPGKISAASSERQSDDEVAKRIRKRQRQQLKRQLVKANASAVYVSGLPPDVTEEEMADIFRRCGALKTQSGVKRYRNAANGSFKDDALVRFELGLSAENAVLLYDDYEIRPGQKMSVQYATFEATDDVVDAILETRPTRVPTRDAERLPARKTRGSRILIFKHLFDPAHVQGSEDDFYDQIEQALAETVQVYGAVERIIVFRKSPVGAASVKFANRSSAEVAFDALSEKDAFAGSNGVSGDGRSAPVEVEFFDGVTDYRADASKHEESEHELARRSAEWEKWLEQQ